MFICIRRQYIYNVIFSLALAVSLISLWGKGDDLESTVSALPVSDMTVVIDAGHGGRDGGAVSDLGTVEKEINLALSKELGNFFVQSGAKVVYTRETDDAIVSEEKQIGTTIKRRDMALRKKIRDGSSADFFISIHMNNFSDSRYSGAQVFYNGTDDRAKLLARSIQAQIKQIADLKNNREAKDSKNNIFLLNDSKAPAVLIECGFLSNSAEEQKLLDSAYREKLAYAIYSGVLKYLSN